MPRGHASPSFCSGAIVQDESRGRVAMISSLSRGCTLQVANREPQEAIAIGAIGRPVHDAKIPTRCRGTGGGFRDHADDVHQPRRGR